MMCFTTLSGFAKMSTEAIDVISKCKNYDTGWNFSIHPVLFT